MILIEKGTFDFHFNFDFHLIAIKEDRRQQIIFKIFCIPSLWIKDTKRERYTKDIDRLSCRKLRVRRYFPRKMLLEILCVLLKVTRRVLSARRLQSTADCCRRAQRSTEKFSFAKISILHLIDTHRDVTSCYSLWAFTQTRRLQIVKNDSNLQRLSGIFYKKKI